MLWFIFEWFWKKAYWEREKICAIPFKKYRIVKNSLMLQKKTLSFNTLLKSPKFLKIILQFSEQFSFWNILN